MSDTPHERISIIRNNIEQQQTTVEALKRDGHEYADAERQLTQMLAELRAGEGPPSSGVRDTGASRLRNRL